MPRKMIFGGRGVPILLVALLQLVLYSIPTADAFSAIKVPSSTWNQRKDAHRSTSLSSQRLPGGFDPSYGRLSEQEEEVDQYLASLKRGQAPPPQAAAPRVLTPEERKAVNDAAKARMEAYQRGELPTGIGQSTLPPPPQPYGYRQQPQSHPPPGYYAAGSPEAAQHELSPSDKPYPPGFNPNYWSDALREFEAKQAAEKAQQEAEEAAATTPSSPPPPPPPPQQQQQQQQQPQQQYQQQERSTDESSGGSRFKALFAAQEAQKNNGGAASPKERLKQFLLSKYAPDDMSEQAVTYRRLIQFADSGYSGPQTQDEYMANLTLEAKEKAAQRLRAVGLTDDAVPPASRRYDPYGSPGPSSPPPAPPSTPGSYGEKGINVANSYMDALTSNKQDRVMRGVSPPPAQQQKAYDYPPQAPLSPPPQQQQGYGYPDSYAATPPPPPTYAQPPPSQPSPRHPYAYQQGYPPQAATPYQQAPPPPPPPVLTYVPPPPPPPVQQQQQQQQPPSAAGAPRSMSPGLQNSVYQLEAYLQRHQSHRLQGQDLDRMEEVLSLVKAGLATEANIGAKRVVSSSLSDPEAPPSATAASTATASSRPPPVYDTSYGEAPPFLGVQERKVLINLAKALEVTAYARDEAEVKSKLAWLSNMMQIATGMVDGWMKGGLGGTSTPSTTQQQAYHSSSPPSPPPIYEQRPPPQQQQQQSPPPPPPAAAAEAVVEERQHTPPSPPPAVPAASTPVAETASPPPPAAAASVPSLSLSRQVATEKELSKEDRAKLQGVMALVLKNSGAFGKMSGPLMGEELDLMRSTLGDVTKVLRTETEEVYGQSVEEYLQANPQAIEEMEAARLAAIETSSPPIPKIETAIKPQISYKDMLKQAREKKATAIMVDSAANNNNNKEETG